MPSLPLLILLRELLKMWMKKRTWWSLNFEKMDEQDDIHIAYAKLYKVSKSMRNCIGWPPRSLVMWNLNAKKSPQSLIKLIKPLEH